MNLIKIFLFCFTLLAPIQGATTFETFVDSQYNFNALNATQPCLDLTPTIFDAILSYKINLKAMENLVLKGMTALRTELQKEEFTALDLMEVAGRSMKTVSLRKIAGSNEIMKVRFEQVKTLFYSMPIARQLYRYMLSLFSFSLQNKDLKDSLQSAKGLWLLLETRYAAMQGLRFEAMQFISSAETSQFVAETIQQWQNAKSACTPTVDVAAAAMGVTGGQTPGLQKIPDAVVREYDVGKREFIARVADSNMSANHSALIVAGMSSASSSYKLSIWKVTAAALVIVGTAFLF
ncbi:LAMI_0C10814g1_1 [Lachancea mirantina]|uniref:LAMI_0C10814g1_1 n=1 Tax=Lachancea mirantina TaxID=1230905 RepID=A0A1G4J669_9SACH|nr:LAMI_0C10814g1_1 [Lachancea mirantina]